MPPFGSSALGNLLEWKYFEGRARTFVPEDEPNDDAGLEPKGVPNGLALLLPGAGEISSLNGLLLLSGVPGRIGVVAVEIAEMPLPL